MRKNIRILSLLYLAFVALLFLSGGIDGLWSEIVYYLAFIIPFFSAIALMKEHGEVKLRISREGAVLFLPTILPTVVLIAAVSYAVSYILVFFTGESNTVDVGDSLPLALLCHAAIPALLEEALFRYLPMRYIRGHSPLVCIVFSSLAFALVHHSFFSIPYAFIAGVAFMTLNLISDSILPSVILHFVNNAMSVLMMLYSSSPTVSVALPIVTWILALISVIIIFVMRKRYFDALQPLFLNGGGLSFIADTLILAVPTLIIAAIELI